VKTALAVLGLVLIALGLISLVQPSYVPGKAAPFGQELLPTAPVVSVAGGLYFKTVLVARGKRRSHVSTLLRL
jgi:hypothetical protein